MRRSIAGVCAAALFLLGPSGGHAADIVFKKADPADRGSATLRLRAIQAGRRRGNEADSSSVFSARPASSSRSGPLATVELSSLGGDLFEGLKLGTLFRDHDVATVVRRSDICLSACALAFLGGTSSHEGPERSADHRLEIGARLGFHTFYLNAGASEGSRHQGFSEARGATAALVHYAADLGIEPRFVAAMMAKPPEELTYVNTTEDFLALKICPIGLERPPASLEEQAVIVCNHSTGSTGPGAARQVRRLAPAQAKRYMLENIQENMSSLKVRGALFEQLRVLLGHARGEGDRPSLRRPQGGGRPSAGDRRPGVRGERLPDRRPGCAMLREPRAGRSRPVCRRQSAGRPSGRIPTGRRPRAAVVSIATTRMPRSTLAAAGPPQLLARPLPGRDGAPASINSGL